MCHCWQAKTKWPYRTGPLRLPARTFPQWPHLPGTPSSWESPQRRLLDTAPGPTLFPTTCSLLGQRTSGILPKLAVHEAEARQTTLPARLAALLGASQLLGRLLLSRLHAESGHQPLHLVSLRHHRPGLLSLVALVPCKPQVVGQTHHLP